VLSSGHSTIRTPNLVGLDESDGDPRVSLGTAHPLAHPAIALHRRRIFGTDPQRGRGQGPETELLNFKTPSINL